jgi:hypothetical protein
MVSARLIWVKHGHKRPQYYLDVCLRRLTRDGGAAQAKKTKTPASEPALAIW